VVNFRFRPLEPRKKSLRTHWRGGLVDTRPKWIVWRNVNSPPQQRIELRFFNSTSRSPVLTLTELSLLRTYNSKDKGNTGLLQTALHQSRTASVHKLCKYYTAPNREKRLVASSCQSFCSHGTRLPLDGFSWKLTFDDFSKICLARSTFIKIGQEQRVLCITNNTHVWSHLAQFFLDWEIFQKKVVEKIKTRFMFNNFFFSKIVPFMR
jgi:hypothetical protein